MKYVVVNFILKIMIVLFVILGIVFLDAPTSANFIKYAILSIAMFYLSFLTFKLVEKREIIRIKKLRFLKQKQLLARQSSIAKVNNISIA